MVPDGKSDEKFLDEKILFVEFSTRSKKKIFKSIENFQDDPEFPDPEFPDPEMEKKRKKVKFPAIPIFRLIRENFEKEKNFAKNSRSESEKNSILNSFLKSLQNFTQIDNSAFDLFNEIKAMKSGAAAPVPAQNFQTRRGIEIGLPGFLFFKLPHKNGEKSNVGNPLSKDFLHFIEEDRLVSDPKEAALTMAKISRQCAYWKMTVEIRKKS